MRLVCIFTLVLTTLTLNMVQAASLCSQVLQSESKDISDEAIAVSIRQIAELKFDLDRAHARGSQEDSGSHYIHDQYPIKYRELVQGLRGRLTEEKISALIKKEIRALQTTHESVNRERIKRVRKEKEYIDIPPPIAFDYERGESKKMSASFLVNSNGSENIYVPEKKHYYYFDQDGFVNLPIAGGIPQKAINDGKAGALLNDGEKMLVFQLTNKGTYRLLTHKFSFYTLDLVSEITVPDSLTLPKNIQNMFLSPSNKSVLLEGFEKGVGYRYSVVDVQTGKELLNQIELPKDVASAALIDDKHLAVLTEDKNLVVIDIATKKTIQSTILNSLVYDPKNDIMPGMILSNDGKILTIAHSSGFISVDAKRIDHKVNEIEDTPAYDSLFRTREYDHAMLVQSADNTIKLMDMRTLTVIFTFEPSSSGAKLLTLAVSPDGSEIMTTSTIKSEKHTELWIRKEKE